MVIRSVQFVVSFAFNSYKNRCSVENYGSSFRVESLAMYESSWFAIWNEVLISTLHRQRHLSKSQNYKPTPSTQTPIKMVRMSSPDLWTLDAMIAMHSIFCTFNFSAIDRPNHSLFQWTNKWKTYRLKIEYIFTICSFVRKKNAFQCEFFNQYSEYIEIEWFSHWIQMQPRNFFLVFSLRYTFKCNDLNRKQRQRQMNKI